MPFGAEVEENGGVRFRVWAPEPSSLSLEIEGEAEPMAMIGSGDGWYELTTVAAKAGSRYWYRLPDGTRVPDPVSRFQPHDVDGPSEVIDPRAYAWRTAGWCGRQWEEAVLYELHVGTFTDEGTFAAATGKLDYLAELGITAIELMALGDFPGRWNWGYDGVLLYAPDSIYGRPEDLKALVDGAHARGIMVILDVVYNHFGPEGNYLPRYFPQIMTDRMQTPWGQALNFDDEHSEQARELIVQNALYWIEEFQMDGLRLDAVHAIFDASKRHILDELANRVRTAAGRRMVHLVLESDDTMWTRLMRDSSGDPLLSTAQWNHDVQQLSRLALTSPADAAVDTHRTMQLGTALTEGFTSELERAEADGARGNLAEGIAAPIPATGFVAFLQTHDLVGNRIHGERITHLAPVERLRALVAIYLLLPQVPMLFMGEEWGASSPFPYFCDFKGELAEAVRRGRIAQFGEASRLEDSAYVQTLPDPLARSTFESAKLHWAEQEEGVHREWLQFYRALLAVRRREIVPLLSRIPVEAGTYTVPQPRAIEVRWKLPHGELRVDANLTDAACACFAEVSGDVLWQEGTVTLGTQLGPWAVRWSFAGGGVA